MECFIQVKDTITDRDRALYPSGYIQSSSVGDGNFAGKNFSLPITTWYARLVFKLDHWVFSHSGSSKEPIIHRHFNPRGACPNLTFVYPMGNHQHFRFGNRSLAISKGYYFTTPKHLNYSRISTRVLLLLNLKQKSPTTSRVFPTWTVPFRGLIWSERESEWKAVERHDEEKGTQCLV